MGEGSGWKAPWDEARRSISHCRQPTNRTANSQTWRTETPAQHAKDLDDLTWNRRALIERVNGTESMIAVCDDHSASLRFSYEEQRRQLTAVVDLLAIFFDVRVADAQ